MKMNKGDIVAIIRGVQPQYVSSITQVLLDEGIGFVEVSLSEEDTGLACIRQIASDFGNSVGLGAGTVMNNKQVDKAIEAGARYIITPGWDTDLVRYIKSSGVEVYPGVYSPSEVMRSVNEGIEIVKLFPAGELGLGYIKSLFGPFPHIKFMAVGGINKDNIMDYYKAGCYSFAIGSELIPRGAVRNDLARIRENASAYMKLMKGVL